MVSENGCKNAQIAIVAFIANIAIIPLLPCIPPIHFFLTSNSTTFAHPLFCKAIFVC